MLQAGKAFFQCVYKVSGQVLKVCVMFSRDIMGGGVPYEWCITVKLCQGGL